MSEEDKIIPYTNSPHYRVTSQGPYLSVKLEDSSTISAEEISPVVDKISNIRTVANNYDWPFAHYLDKSANILVLAVSGEVQKAIESAHDLEKTILKTKTLLSRLRYALVVFILFVMVIIGAILLFWSCDFSFTVILKNEIKLLVACILFGGIGGFMSIVWRINELDIDIHSPWRMLAFTGVLRFSLAMVCGMIVFFIMKGRIVSFVGDPQNIYAYFVISCVAGFSEHFVPNTLDKISGNKG
ncbi:hypothetical protein [Maridesulfovibrio sp.]|uniref:hypothetical protein n=1 Tax=Maridesulfovibrio sp. TaxID=2795000 RepID=UPI002A18E6E0|nr:hypothetical protein [Maridesulfovibrio sp.]